MTNLYEKHKAAWDKAAADGRTNLAEAAKWFQTPREMEVAIGFHKAVHHWIKGNPASRTSDERARRWLDDQRIALAVDPAPAPVPAPVVTQAVLLLVACPLGTDEKARKLLAFIGCEVTEV